MAEVQEEMLHPQLRASGHSGGPVAGIEAANRAYLVAYRRNARLMALLDQVATIDEAFRRLRVERALAFAERNARAIRELQEQGLADPELDALVAAHAVSGMVSRMAQLVFVHGHAIDFETLVATVTRLWANALRIPPDDERPAAGPA
jgi:hypothetical protein